MIFNILKKEERSSVCRGSSCHAENQSSPSTVSLQDSLWESTLYVYGIGHLIRFYLRIIILHRSCRRLSWSDCFLFTQTEYPVAGSGMKTNKVRPLSRNRSLFVDVNLIWWWVLTNGLRSLTRATTLGRFSLFVQTLPAEVKTPFFVKRAF